MIDTIKNYFDERLSDNSKLVIFVIFLLLFVALSVYLFITYLFEFFILQAYCYGLMKSDSPVKAAWYTVFILVAYAILKIILLNLGVVIN